MKKIYDRPMMHMVNVETSSFIAASPGLRWTARENIDDPSETVEDSNWGLINYDKGEGNYKKDEDPWNSDNW